MFKRTKGKTLVLDIGKGRVTLAQFKRNARGAFELNGLDSTAIEFGHAGNQEACEQLSAFLRAARTRFRFARALTLTLSHLALTKTINTPAVVGPKRAKIVEFEASQAIPSQLEEVCWNWRVMTEHAEGLEVCVAAVKADVIRAILAAIAGVGLEAARVVPASLAARTAFRHAHRTLTTTPALVVCIGRTATQLLYVDGERFATRGLAFGWSARADDAAIDPAADPFVHRLTSEIARSRVHFQPMASGTEVSELYLCGDGPLANWRSALGTALGCNVRLFDPLGTFIVAGECAGEIAVIDRATIVSLVGGAASTELSDDDCINLVPADLQARRAFRRRQPALALAAGFAVLALVPPLLHLQREQRALRHALASCELEQQYLRAARQRGAAYESRLAAANHAAELLGGIEKIRTAWPSFLAEIERSVTSAGDLWLDSLAVRPGAAVAASRQSPAEARSVEIEISGRAIERGGGTGAEYTRSKPSEQVRQLLADFRTSPLFTAVHDERFESGGSGELRFAVVLTLKQEHAL